MSFDKKNLSVLAYANGFTLWHYTTPDDAVTSEGYFDDGSSLLRAGDMVLVNSRTGGHDKTGGDPRFGVLAIGGVCEGSVTVSVMGAPLC